MPIGGENRSAGRLGLASDLGLLGAAAAAPLAVGSVHPEAWLGLFVAATLGLGLALLADDSPARPHGLILALIVAGGVAVLLPLLPLPPALLSAVSPEAARVWALGVPGGEVDEAWRPIHQAPGPGLFQAFKWLTVSVFALACAVRSTTPGWSRRVPVVISAAGLLSIVICTAQTLAGSQTILGLYTPPRGHWTDLRPTMVNLNHWAAWVGFASLAGLELALRVDRGLVLRGLGLLTTAACGVQLLLAGSRGGLLSAGVGRGFVRTYYANSPSVAGQVRKSEIVKAGIRRLIGR